MYMSFTSFDLSKDNEILITGNRLGQCSTWSLLPDISSRGNKITSVEPLHDFHEQSGSIIAVKFSPSEIYYASASMDGTCVVYDLETQQRLVYLKLDHTFTALSFIFSDWQMLVADTSGDLFIFEFKDGLSIIKLEEKGAGLLNSIGVHAMCPNLVLTAGDERDLKLWSITDFKMVDYCIAHDKEITALSSSSSSPYFLTGDSSGTICLWMVPISSYPSQNCSNKLQVEKQTGTKRSIPFNNEPGPATKQKKTEDQEHDRSQTNQKSTWPCTIL